MKRLTKKQRDLLNRGNDGATYEERDLLNVQRMMLHLESVEDDYRNALRADDKANGWGDDWTNLNFGEKMAVYRWYRGRGQEPDKFDFLEFINEDALELSYTGLPPSGVNTRGYDAPRLRAGYGEVYVWLMFAWGGPSYGIRALATFGNHGTLDWREISFVYQDWFVGYETDQVDFDLWADVLDRVAGDIYTRDEIEDKMRETADQCRNCGEWFDEEGDAYFCPDCRGRFCSSCGENYDEEELVESRMYGMVCETCLGDFGLFKCDLCGEAHPLREAVEVKTRLGLETHCGECADDHAVECALCGGIVDRDMTFGVDIGSGYACTEHKSARAKGE